MSEAVHRWSRIENVPRFRKVWVLHANGDEGVAEHTNDGWRDDAGTILYHEPIFWREASRKVEP